MIPIWLIDILSALFDLCFLALAVFWTLRWVVTVAQRSFGIRDWLGSLGLATGILSTLLYLVFIVFLLVEKRILAHGALLWIYYYTGGILGGLCLVLGSFGRGWLRWASMVVSVVMLFHWWRLTIPSVKAGAVVTLLMFLTVLILGLVWLRVCTMGRRPVRV